LGSRPSASSQQLLRSFSAPKRSLKDIQVSHEKVLEMIQLSLQNEPIQKSTSILKSSFSNLTEELLKLSIKKSIGSRNKVRFSHPLVTSRGFSCQDYYRYLQLKKIKIIEEKMEKESVTVSSDDELWILDSRRSLDQVPLDLNELQISHPKIENIGQNLKKLPKEFVDSTIIDYNPKERVLHHKGTFCTRPVDEDYLFNLSTTFEQQIKNWNLVAQHRNAKLILNRKSNFIKQDNSFQILDCNSNEDTFIDISNQEYLSESSIDCCVDDTFSEIDFKHSVSSSKDSFYTPDNNHQCHENDSLSLYIDSSRVFNQKGDIFQHASFYQTLKPLETSIIARDLLPASSDSDNEEPLRLEESIDYIDNKFESVVDVTILTEDSMEPVEVLHEHHIESRQIKSLYCQLTGASNTPRSSFDSPGQTPKTSLEIQDPNTINSEAHICDTCNQEKACVDHHVRNRTSSNSSLIRMGRKVKRSRVDKMLSALKTMF
jgi:hypothetical protein